MDPIQNNLKAKNIETKANHTYERENKKIIP